MIEVIKGDLLLADTKAICQQVNCQGVMGAGLAKEIADRYPNVKRHYLEFCAAADDPAKLLGEVHAVLRDPAPFDVLNIFGQLSYGRQRGVTYTDYDALERAFFEVNRMYAGMSVAFPWRFGCGLAGGDWTVVMNLILACMQDCRVKVYIP